MAITDNTQCATIPYVTLDSCLISPTYITETWQKKNQPKLIHTLIVAPIVHMRHLTPHTRYTIYDTFPHTHATAHKLTTLLPHPLFFPMLLCKWKHIPPPLTIHKPIEYTHSQNAHNQLQNSKFLQCNKCLKKNRKKNHHNKSPSARITLFR